MEEEKIYKLKNGKEMVLLTNANYNGIRYLLLCDGETDEIKIAYEEDKKLIYIDKENPNFSDILITLFKKFKNEVN